MNEIEKQILKNQRTILWEHWRKYFIKYGNTPCVEMIEIEEEVQRTNNLLNSPKQKTIAERTHDAFLQ